MDLRYTSISEINITIPSKYEEYGANLPGYIFDEIQEFRMIEVPNWGWFQIRDVKEVSDGIRLVKEITAYSAECLLQSKQVISLEGEYKLYDPLNPYDSILGMLLLKIPGWKIGTVDGTLLNQTRTFNISKQNLYTLMANDLGEAFDCVFIFDFINFTINVKDLSQPFKNTSIYLSYNNLIKNSTVETLTDKIVTALYVKGGNFDITGVNPNGTDVIYNVDYYKDRMSSSLLSALTTYENKYKSLQPSYISLLTQLKTAQKELALLNSNPPTYNVSFTANKDGTLAISNPLTSISGLSELQELRDTLESVKAARIEEGNIPYTDVNAQVIPLDVLITNKKNDIIAKENLITTLQTQITNIVNQLKMESNFTDSQWIELNQYFIYDTFQDDTFIWTDIMTQEEKLSLQQELFEYGARALSRCSFPRYKFEIDSIDFLALPEFQYFTGQFELGSTFTLDLDRYNIKPLLQEVHINFDDPTDFKLTYSNKTMLDGGFSLEDFNSGNVNTSNTISFDLVKIEAMMKQNDYVTEFINGSLETINNNIITSKDKSVITWDGTGLHARSYDHITGKQRPTEAWWTGSYLAFSDNNFTSSRLAIGKIDYPGSLGGSGYGVIGDILVGRIVAGNNLHISNQNNNFRLNETGAWLDNAHFTLTKGANVITLDPDIGMTFKKGLTEVIKMDIVTGDATFQGRITGGTINIGDNFIVELDGTVQIKKGSLNINDNFIVSTDGSLTMKKGSINIAENFTVDNLGNVVAKSLKLIGGSINLNDNFIVDSSGNTTIKKGSINIANNFIVDTSGNVVAKSLALTGGSITIGDKFKVDSLGNLIANDVDLTGKIRLSNGSININSIFIVDEYGNVTIKQGSINLGSGAFTVDNAGNTNITKGSLNIGGNFIVTSDGTIQIKRGSFNIADNFIVDMLGNVTAKNLTLSGGSININDKFTVDPSGNMVAKSGTFSGNLSGGSININDKFTVDPSGNCIANSFNMTGGNISGGSINYGNINVNSGGNLTATNVDVSGKITATSGSFSGELRAATGTFNGIFAGELSADKITTGYFSADRIRGGILSGVQIESDYDISVGTNLFMGVERTGTGAIVFGGAGSPLISGGNTGINILAYGERVQLAGSTIQMFGSATLNGERILTTADL